jgi:hypothetical protein
MSRTLNAMLNQYLPNCDPSRPDSTEPKQPIVDKTAGKENPAALGQKRGAQESLERQEREKNLRWNSPGLSRFERFSKRDLCMYLTMLTEAVARPERNESRRGGSGPWRCG